MLVAVKFTEREDLHEALASLQLLQRGINLARTTSAEIVDPVIAVRRNPELAKPFEYYRGRRMNGNRAKKNIIRIRQVRIARESPPLFLLGRSPGICDGGLLPSRVHRLVARRPDAFHLLPKRLFERKAGFSERRLPRAAWRSPDPLRSLPERVGSCLPCSCAKRWPRP